MHVIHSENPAAAAIVAPANLVLGCPKVLRITNSFLFGIDQSIGSLDKVPSSEIGAGCLIHKELCQCSAASTLVCPIQTALQMFLTELRILFGRLDQLSFR